MSVTEKFSLKNVFHELDDFFVPLYTANVNIRYNSSRNIPAFPIFTLTL